MPVCTVCHHAPERSKLKRQLDHFPEVVLLGHNADPSHDEEGAREPIIENMEDLYRTEDAHQIYRRAIRRRFYIAFVKNHENHNPKWARRWLRSLGAA